MVDVVPEEAIHEQKPWYMNNGCYVGRLALYDYYKTRLVFPPTFVRVSSTVSNGWHAIAVGCPSFST